MAKFEDKYDQLKIEKLKETIQRQVDNGNAPYYEIYVDALKAVSKTNDITEFDNYENFMMEDTEKVRILVYTSSPKSPRNDQFTYLLKKKEPVLTAPSSLNGFDIDAKIDEKLKQQREQWENDLVRQELERTKKQLKEAEEYSEKLEAELSALREKKSHVGNVNLGELASVALEGIVRRNPQLIAKIPGAESLAGIIEADNKEKANQLAAAAEPQTEVSFKKKTAESQHAGTENTTAQNATLTDEEKGYIQFMRCIAESFEEEEIILLTHIIQKLEEDSSQLKTVAELLNVNVAEALTNARAHQQAAENN